MRVVIAEDQVLLREGLRRLFDDAAHEVVATLGDAEALPSVHRDAQARSGRARYTYASDLHRRGCRATKSIKEAHPDLGVLVLSQHVETTYAVSLVSLGGFGYLLKDRVLEVDEFLATAERVARGGSALDPTLVAHLVRPVNGDGPIAALSERERDVLALMAEGLTNAGIAQRLYLSERTVEAHVRHVLVKLDIPESEHGHRRVLAVLAHLRAAQS